MDETAAFERERPRLLRIAGRILRDDAEAEDIVQQTWLRLHSTEAVIDNLPGWLTTVTTRLCLDRLRAPKPILVDDLAFPSLTEDPADALALADTVGIALQVVLDRLTPNERVAFVLHDSFSIDFPTIAAMLGTTPAAARKLASRARSKVRPQGVQGRADWEVVDAFLAAARQGDFEQLLALLAPGAVVAGDEAAISAGTPTRMEGRSAVAAMFNGAAKAALPVFIDGRPGAAWFHRGSPRVAFDFTVVNGVVDRIDFIADPAILERLIRRAAGAQRN
ncbi:sigma-70 family RNA polymerase sigma factor [Cryobacterium sp. PH29-G1]|uniref:sigma-70 family RNA polymerase sigma factor n=1 Tax=Cryobacterium sp. PH29-G1 TaxID=3046211 RepID=UPI0024B8E511|nr:sigma-70 family RNA polymerase sigma factor [Cryobacterium sp. PH29-G1]MDJ0350258.1 sigma-70 family RNA polymerase sigma factor [Cryobacterium sp. PH29-G1]